MLLENLTIYYIYIFVCRVFCTNTVPGTSTAKQYTEAVFIWSIIFPSIRWCGPIIPWFGFLGWSWLAWASSFPSWCEPVLQIGRDAAQRPQKRPRADLGTLDGP